VQGSYRRFFRATPCFGDQAGRLRWRLGKSACDVFTSKMARLDLVPAMLANLDLGPRMLRLLLSFLRLVLEEITARGSASFRAETFHVVFSLIELATALRAQIALALAKEGAPEIQGMIGSFARDGAKIFAKERADAARSTQLRHEDTRRYVARRRVHAPSE
jgi:hypothetical protein